MLSIIIPVYFNTDNLQSLYNDLSLKVIEKIDCDCEIVMVDDGSKDDSYDIMRELTQKDSRVRAIRLSKNFGSHAAVLCGLDKCKGDCAVVKSADMQEPSELILQMYNEWKNGNNVVLAVRKQREDSKANCFFAGIYYRFVKTFALHNMPKEGFDIYLIDRKVINVLTALDERNSALTGQILWSGFKTSCIEYTRKEREIGVSRWTLKKKIKLVADTLFSFSTIPVGIVEVIGVLSLVGSMLWAVLVVILRFLNRIKVEGWTTLFIFNLFSFGITMVTMGIIGEYLWRTFDAARDRPAYIVEEDTEDDT